MFVLNISRMGSPATLGRNSSSCLRGTPIIARRIKKGSGRMKGSLHPAAAKNPCPKCGRSNCAQLIYYPVIIEIII